MGARRLVVGNWKLHKTPVESVLILRELITAVAAEAPACDLAVAPGFLFLRQAHGRQQAIQLALDTKQPVCKLRIERSQAARRASQHGSHGRRQFAREDRTAPSAITGPPSPIPTAFPTVYSIPEN